MSDNYPERTCLLVDQWEHSQGATSSARRRLLTVASTAPLSETCYLWRNFATTSYRANEYEIYVPAQGEYFGVYSFRDYIASSGGILHFGRMKEGIPVVNLVAGDGSVTKVGSWAASANNAMYNGSNQRSSTAGDTLTATVTGHTLILRTIMTTNGGFGLVSIDGDFTLANRLPLVTQALVDAGYFVAGDLGKRYWDWYSQNQYEDEQIPLAEGLVDTSHTVRIVVKGTKRAASSSTRCYCAALAAATQGTLVTDSNASMGYLREVTNQRDTHVFSQMTVVPEFSPGTSTPDNFQFMGGNHENESLVAQQFLVDTVVSAPAAGEYMSGREVRFERTSHLTHPDMGGTIIGKVRHAFSGRADRSFQLTCRYALQWQVAGKNRDGFYGMLHLGNAGYTLAGYERNPDWLRALVGDRLIPDLSTNTDEKLGRSPADTVAAYSSDHNVVAVIHVPRLDLNVNNYALDQSGTYVRDRTDTSEKIYFARSSVEGANEPIAAGDCHTGEINWKVFRVKNARTTLETLY